MNSSGQPRGRSARGDETEVADLVIARLTRRGVVERKALLDADVSANEIDHRVRRKRLIPAFRGTYFVGHPDPAEFAWEYSALKVGGEDSVLFYRTAAVLHRLLPTQIDPTVHIAHDAKREDREGLKFHEVRLPPDEVRTIHADLRVTTPARTLLDNADHPQLENLVADAIRRTLTGKRELERLLVRHKGTRHSTRLRAVLDEGPRWTASEAERRMIALIRRAKLPLPESNQVLGRSSPDLVWREQRLIVEIDSRGFHGDVIAFGADRRRDRTRIVQGWTAIRFTWDEIRDDPMMVVGELAAALAVAGSRTRPAR